MLAPDTGLHLGTIHPLKCGGTFPIYGVFGSDSGISIMRGTLNAHKVFKGTRVRPGYLQALDLDSEREQTLRDSRETIRQALRQSMPEWQDLAKSQRLVESRHLALASELPPLRPRFRMQGSSVYHTLNVPAHMPPQEVDYDDGVFLPTSFVDGGGKVQPLLAAKGYFRAHASPHFFFI